MLVLQVSLCWFVMTIEMRKNRIVSQKHVFNITSYFQKSTLRFSEDIKIADLLSKIGDFWWGRTDSNHRSDTQQIYSLSPLATRELPQI